MPRPTRSKVVSSAPAPRVSKLAKQVLETLPDPPAAATATVFNNIYDISDPDEGVVISARVVKKDNGKRVAPGARGARGQINAIKSDTRDLLREDSLSKPGEKTAVKGHVPPEEYNVGVGIEDIDLESSSPAVEVARRERSMPATENSLLALGNFKRRPRQPSILGRAAARARSSSVESKPGEDNGFTSVGKRNNSVLGNRHSRQASLGRSAPAHLGSIFNVGKFKRRASQRSIPGTAQKDRHQQPMYDDDEDDFNPEDESTPLNLSKTRDMASSSSASNPRKRKLTALQVSRSSPPIPFDQAVDRPETIPASGSPQLEIEAEGEPQSSDEAPLPSVEGQDVNSELMSETMAPPLSSSSSPEPEPPSYKAAQRLRTEREAARGRRRLRTRTPPVTQDSPISSPPSLTHSPNFPTAKTAPKAKSQRQAPPLSTLSTAQLQALLPRRRRRGPRDPLDIPSSDDEIDVSGLASDDDELTHSSIRAQPSRRSVIPRIPPSRKAPRKTKAAPKPGVKHAYGPRPAPTTSDKENEEVDPNDSLAPLPDDEDANASPEDSQELEKRVGKELKRAARKFEEVDKWQLEFEEYTASSSSPNYAR